MLKLRILFEKTGKAKYTSHLDLMNVFRRSFNRAGIPIHYTQGFNPHPYLSVAMPLPTAFDGKAELLDFDLDADEISADFVERLNGALPEGLSVKKVYERVTQPKEIVWADYTVCVHGEGLSAESIEKLLSRSELLIMKKSKSGEKEVNFIEFLHSFTVTDTEYGVCIRTILSAGNVKTINPTYLVGVIETYMPDVSVEYADYCREACLTGDMKVFL